MDVNNVMLEKKLIIVIFLKVVKSTKFMLSAPQLQGLEVNIYVHFHLVIEQLIGISFPK